ncbi:Trm112 family protein [Psychrosphaera sp.]|nr:Trm112 family protein [Psychrosphaera sp.]
MAFDTKLLNIIACPICKSKLHYAQSTNELICKVDRIAYAINEDIPVMLEGEARQLSQEEIEQYK